MTRIGYKRVSTTDQTTDRQDLGDCSRVFEEKLSGKNTDRPALQEMIRYVREGDLVVVWSIDRLARDLRDLQQIISDINEKGAAVEFLSERLKFDPTSNDPMAKLQLQMMGAFAEFERSIILKRQREGIEKAKARGVYKGGVKTIDRKQVWHLKDQGLPIAHIAKEMGISRASIYNILKE